MSGDPSANNQKPVSNPEYRFFNVQKENRAPKEGASGSGAFNAVKNTTNTGLKTAGTTARVAGVGLKATGSTLKVGGAGLTAAGAALSTTGAGALVGVPLVAAGRAMAVGGQAASSAGRVSGRMGRRLQLKGRPIKFKKPSLGGISILDWTFISWLLTIWWLQVVFAIVGLAALGISSSFKYMQSAVVGDLIEQTPNIHWTITLAKYIKSAIGGTLAELAEMFGSVFSGFYLFVFLLGILSLLLVGMRLIISQKSPFSGKKAGLKIGIFLSILILYALPLTSLLPWAIAWLLVVNKIES
jgi:hypothetical protein